MQQSGPRVVRILGEGPFQEAIVARLRRAGAACLLGPGGADPETADAVVFLALHAPGAGPLAAVDAVLGGACRALMRSPPLPTLIVQVVQPDGGGTAPDLRAALRRGCIAARAEGRVALSLSCHGLYGPGLRAEIEGGPLPTWLTALRTGAPIGLGPSAAVPHRRCALPDAADAVLLALRQLCVAPDTAPPVADVGDDPAPDEHLLELLLALHGRSWPVTRAPAAPELDADEWTRRLPDWRSATALADGLRGTLRAAALPAEGAAVDEAIPVIRPHYGADEPLLASIRAAFALGQTTNAGTHVRGLEADFSEWLGVADVLSTRSGAASLDLVALALPRRGKVLLPTFTYIATLNAFERAGFEPLLADVDPHTWTLCPEHTRALLAAHPDVSVIVPVNVFGVPPDLDALLSLADEAGAALVYDNAHGVGTTVRGQRYDPRPTATAFSLHATKLLPSIEGGLLTCRDDHLRTAVLRLRTHGIFPDPLDAVPGFNAKLDDIAAVTARHGLRRFDGILARRRAYGDRLVSTLEASGGWRAQRVPSGVTTNYQNLCLRTPGGLERTASIFAAHRVGVRRYFDPPLHALRRFADRPPLPIAASLCAELVCFPLHSEMSDAQLDRIEAAALEACP